jgi:hypothetical protein
MWEILGELRKKHLAVTIYVYQHMHTIQLQVIQKHEPSYMLQ